MSQDHVLRVWGSLACFTRPELKVERFSYPVITPSAARGIYDAIFCKPLEFRWQVTRVDVFEKPQYIALRRNEVKDKAPPASTIIKWIKGKEDPRPIIADGTTDLLGTDQKGRTQRQTMALKNVCYQLHAQLQPWNGFYNRLSALEAQFQRRASKGKCFYQPYLGCREFPAFFELLDSPEKIKSPPDIEISIGMMLYDVFDLSHPGKALDTTNAELPGVSLFRAKVENGILVVPPYDSDKVLKGRRMVDA